MYTSGYHTGWNPQRNDEKEENVHQWVPHWLEPPAHNEKEENVHQWVPHWLEPPAQRRKGGKGTPVGTTLVGTPCSTMKRRKMYTSGYHTG